MARGDNVRGGNRGGGNRSSGNRGANRSRNNNPEGHNQYSGGGVVGMARERPFAAALGAAAAVGAGVFLWSRRNQISNQLSGLSDQIGEWTENMRSGGDDDDFGSIGTDALVTGESTSSRKSGGSRKSQQQLSEEALSLKETGEL